MNDQNSGELETQLAELGNALQTFHREVQANPELWRDTQKVAAAWRVAMESEQARNALDRELVMRMRRERAHRLQAQTRGDDETDSADDPSPDPLELHRFRALEGFGQFVHATDYVRRLTNGEGTYLQDLERKARLRWLIGVLGAVQQRLARETEGAWIERGNNAGTMSGMVERWESRTTDQLVRLLKPLLIEV